MNGEIMIYSASTGEALLKKAVKRYISREETMEAIEDAIQEEYINQGLSFDVPYVIADAKSESDILNRIRSRYQKGGR